MLFGVLPLVILPYFIYRVLLVRTSSDKWTRECSMPEDAEYKALYDEALAWRNEYLSSITPVGITSDGFKLAGEYCDFGFDKAVIIIAGRTEGCYYSYFFAEPYRRSGYNVLVIDNRSHGLSEGRINSLGYKEYRDILAWGRMLRESKGVSSVVLHGICIGGSTALFAMTDKDCPDYFDALIAEGMYTRFGDSFDEHMILQGRPMFPFSPLAKAYIRLCAGADVVGDGPYKRLPLLTKPALLLHSKVDEFSLASTSKAMYDKTGSNCSVVWFRYGAHSRIRCVSKDEYDRTVIDFLSKL